MSPMRELRKALSDFIRGGDRGGRQGDMPPRSAIKCEVDGEPMAGVCFASIEIEKSGGVRLMLFTDPITRLPWWGQDRVEAPTYGRADTEA